MKIKYILYLAISMLMVTGCSDDDDTSTTAAADCTTLKTNLVAAEDAFDASQTTDTCNALVAAGGAFLSGGCEYCEANAEACLDDESNEDTCCDEPTQADLDELVEMCAVFGDTGGDSAACMTNLMTYSEAMAGDELTQPDCEVAYAALNDYCLDSCDDAMGDDYDMCADMDIPDGGWSDADITATCELVVAMMSGDMGMGRK